MTVYLQSVTQCMFTYSQLHSAGLSAVSNTVPAYLQSTHSLVVDELDTAVGSSPSHS